MKDLLIKMNKNKPATPIQIDEAEQKLGKKFPEEYVEFLGITNGAEGFVGEEYLELWKVEDVAERHAKYEIEKFCPGLIVFASDGGGESYGFDTRSSLWPIVRVPTVPMNWKDAIDEGTDFSNFLEKLSRK